MSGRLIWFRVGDSDIESIKGTLVVQAAVGLGVTRRRVWKGAP
jgi:hypothetical protein